MNNLLLRHIVSIMLLLLPMQANAVNPSHDWQSLHTDNFSIHFDRPHEKTARHVANISESVHQRLSVELNWQPSDKTHIVLSDETDFANGFATVINFNRSVLYMAPPVGVAGLEDFDDWLNLLITHEYTHVLHLDKAEGNPAALRSIFGRFILSFPNLLEPSWMVEGLATYKETDHVRNIGRGQSALFSNMMRVEVMAGIKPVEQVNLPVTTWPAGNTRYLYGVYFFEFIKQQYGEAKVQALIEEYSNNLLPFSLNATFNQVFGKNLSQMWDEYSRWLEDRFSKDIQRIKNAGEVAGEKITESAYLTGPVRVTSDAVYYVENSGSGQAVLIKNKGGIEMPLTEVTKASFDVSNNGDIVLSQIDVCDEYQVYNDLYVYSEETKQLKQITDCERYVRAIWHPDGKQLYALKHETLQFSLFVLSADGVVEEKLIDFDDGTIVAWFDVSPDAKEMVFALWKPDYGWNLYQYNLKNKQWNQLTKDNQLQVYPEYSSDGKSIFYSADYNRSYDLYRYDRKEKSHHQLSRTYGGAFQSSNHGNDIYYIGYTSQGSDVYHLKDYSSIKAYLPKDGNLIRHDNYSDVEIRRSEYTPWPSLRPRSWFPSLVITEDVAEIGITTSGNDALGLHNYFVAPSYDFSNQLPALQLVYSYSNVFSVGLARTNDIFKTLTGQLDRIRSEDSLQFIFSWPNTKLLSSSALLMSLSWENSFDNKLFAAAVPVGDFANNQLGLAWIYNSARRHPLSISLNDGREVKLVAEDSEVLSSDFDGQVYTFSWKEYFRLGGEHVLALNVLQGWGEGVTSNFQLGGEDTGVAYTLLLQKTGVGLFDRRDYALRGYEDGLPQLRGRRAQTLSLEWRFPGQRIERGIMVPPIGIMQWSGSVFAETGAAYNGNTPNQYFSSAGLELTADLNIAYLVPVRARFGLAHGFDELIGDTRIYLSLGSSF